MGRQSCLGEMLEVRPTSGLGHSVRGQGCHGACPWSQAPQEAAPEHAAWSSLEPLFGT